MFCVDVSDDDGGDKTARESFPNVLMLILERELACSHHFDDLVWEGWLVQFDDVTEPYAGTKLSKLCKVGSWVDPCHPPS